MVKSSSIFICQQCGHEDSKWFGKCPSCSSWNSAVETAVQQRGNGIKSSYGFKGKKSVSLSSVPSKSTTRTSTKISELDRVLGGGLVSGQVTLIAGEPGIGKSTLLLQVAQNLGNVLYVSGEESAHQIKIRADRLRIKNKSIQIMEETDVDSVVAMIESQKPSTNNLQLLIVDSIQTMSTSDLSGMAGSVGQVRECAFRMVRYAKENNTPVFLVGHITKEGTVAGPTTLMHIVDTVLWFEGDKSLSLRLLRAVKNRFGPTDEVGIFEMGDIGLGELDSEKLFLSQGNKSVPGSVITSILQGTRPILIEIQSLVVPTKMAFPKRIAQGIDSRRLEVLLAVLTRICGLPLYEYDVFINIAGGINIKNDPSSDLAVCLAIASAYFNKILPVKTLVVGEVGLLGDIRQVIQEDKRIKDAKRMGYGNIVNSQRVKYLNIALKKFLQ